ncbi:aminotransferase class I/II-fold pyridoxal phosphate-dependent enzyme [candidate division WOR-3 bacterium]|uniref:Aminotransferase class I/II-fold pyridoxal phosphate-dependent enzyme n=1 Tax=candidate division WOR-3 bacterium TaxID=2052148 RepID=A0A9D5QCM7_UNCW3|nr:aminotransferase class I/II-fold pyridoxal phosphate-dependent enzyme [candidate division WOR-3 bacterium]MBD3364151.1 aminotransferase class I/II-fold pyridoxal phosphate-dependent enzyme [candidate division WOR-3 bacterium]
MKDLFSKCSEEGGYFSYFRMRGDRYFAMPVLESPPGRIMQFQGKKMVQWIINDYLGLTSIPEIKEAAIEAAKRWGVYSPMGARILSGNTEYHVKLEKMLSEHADKEDAALFNYGYMGVQGTTHALIGKDDVIVIDKLSHASMMDAAFATRQFIPFRHNDPESLERALKRARRLHEGGILIMIEGVYGMTGDIADLPPIVELKKKYGARIFMDDAHGHGTMGKGRGLGFHFGLQDEIDVYFGTFAKAYAAIGGFSAAPKDVCEYIRFNARSQVFAKSLPLVVVWTIIKTIEYLKAHPEQYDKLWENTNKLQNGLCEAGFSLGKTQSPVTPVMVPAEDFETGMKFLHKMRDEKHILISGVMYPVVPKGVFLARMIPTAAHTDEDIDITIKAFKEVRDELGLKWGERFEKTGHHHAI